MCAWIGAAWTRCSPPAATSRPNCKTFASGQRRHALAPPLAARTHFRVQDLKTGREPHRNNVQLGRFGRNRSNVMQYPGVNPFRRDTEERAAIVTLHRTKIRRTP
jgi:hypothetical protein